MGSGTADEAAGLSIVRRLAVGGMAEVFLARDAAGGDVVLKVLLPHLAKDPDMVAAFEHEAIVGARLAHPRIAEVRGSGTRDGAPCLVLSRIDGVTLEEILARVDGPPDAARRVPLGAVVAFALDLLDALAHAHEAADERGAPLHLVHRDVSPSNVFVTREGRAVLGDFGIARSALREGRTRTGAVKGTLGYLAPEQVTGSEVDARADLFSVGVLVFELATGARFAPAGGDLERLRAAEAPVFRAPSERGADARLDAILRRALARFPEERHGSARALRRELAALVTEAELAEGRAHLAALVAAAAGPPSARGGTAPTERGGAREPSPPPGASREPAPPDAPSAPPEAALQGAPSAPPEGAPNAPPEAAPAPRPGLRLRTRGRIVMGAIVGLGLAALAIGEVDLAPSTPAPSATGPAASARGAAEAPATELPAAEAPSPRGSVPPEGATASALPSATPLPASSAASPAASSAAHSAMASSSTDPTGAPAARTGPGSSPRSPASAPSAAGSTSPRGSTSADAEPPPATDPSAAPEAPAVSVSAKPAGSTREATVRAKLDGVSARLRDAKRRGADTSRAEARAAIALEAFLDRRYDDAEREIDAIAASLPR